VPDLHLLRNIKLISQKNERPIILFDDDDDNNNNNLKAKVKPEIKGATGIYSKSFGSYLSNVPGKHEIKEIQKEQSYWALHTYFGKYQCNNNAFPLQAWSVPEGSRKLRFPDFMTTAQDSGKVVSLKHRPPLPPGNSSGTHFC